MSKLLWLSRLSLLPLVAAACSPSPQASSPTGSASTPPAATPTAATTTATSAAATSSASIAPASIDDLSTFPPPPAKCVASWTIETCAKTPGTPPTAGVSFDAGLLVLTSRDVPDGCAFKTNPTDALAVKMTQFAPDSDFEVVVDVEKIEGTGATNAVLFFADPAGHGGPNAEAILGGDATAFGTAIHTYDEAKGKSDSATSSAKRGPGTLGLVRKGKTITASAAVLDGKPITKTIAIGTGPYVVGIGLRTATGKGNASACIGEFTVKDKSGKLRADGFECSP